jgi:primosomal protein DnaI
MEKVKFKYTPVSKDSLIEDLLDNPFLNNFFIENDLDSDTIEKHLLDLMNFNKEKQFCMSCKGLNECKLVNRGLEPALSYRDGKIMTSYKECKFLRISKRKEEQMGHIDAMHLPSRVLQASLDDFDFERGENKQVILNKMKTFITKIRNGETVNGMYLHGRNNTGKTYCLSALATELMKNNIDVIIAYYPDLVREFKSRVSNNSLEEVVSKLKQVQVLMLDDIGGEGTSVWVRDEILGPILQYRLLDHKPTFFSSNYTRKKLVQDHFAKFSRETDNLNATRIGIRIAELTKDNEIEL